MDALRAVLDPWLGRPQWKQSEGRVTFNYRCNSEDTPPIRLKLKVEINSREHFSVYGINAVPFSVQSRWFEGSCEISSYHIDELLGTKMRALYQRRKGRDLFDLATALRGSSISPQRVVQAFSDYLGRAGRRVTREEFTENIAAKLASKVFMADIGPLLASGHACDLHADADLVRDQLIARLPD